MKRSVIVILMLLLFPFITYANDDTKFTPKIISDRENSRDNPYGDIKKKPLNKNIYDLSFVAYDKEFAKEFGLAGYGVAMDKGLRFIEVRMITEGEQTNCYYNVVLDKSIKLDFPDKDYYKTMMHQGFNLPASRNTSSKISKNRMALYTHNTWKNSKKYWNKTYLGNRDYKFNTSGNPFSNGSAFSVLVSSYIQSRHDKYNIISTYNPCGGSNIYYHPKPSFWIRKKDAAGVTNLPQLKNYHVFEIPKDIVRQFKPILVDYIDIKMNNKEYK